MQCGQSMFSLCLAHVTLHNSHVKCTSTWHEINTTDWLWSNLHQDCFFLRQNSYPLNSTNNEIKVIFQYWFLHSSNFPNFLHYLFILQSAHLMYKVLYKRENADSTSTISNIFFQRKVPQFKFHLPSGYKGILTDYFNSIWCSPCSMPPIFPRAIG